jgi:hypothetical protein
MNDLDAFLDLPASAQACVLCFIVSATGLFAVLLLAPRRNCFFLRWRPKGRFIALLFSPALLILWPIVLYALFLKSRGIDPNDVDFDDD